MIIDWHTHVHPPKEAARPFWQGKCPATIENVLKLHDEADLDISVISSAGHYLLQPRGSRAGGAGIERVHGVAARPA